MKKNRRQRLVDYLMVYGLGPLEREQPISNKGLQFHICLENVQFNSDTKNALQEHVLTIAQADGHDIEMCEIEKKKEKTIIVVEILGLRDTEHEDMHRRLTSSICPEGYQGSNEVPFIDELKKNHVVFKNATVSIVQDVIKLPSLTNFNYSSILLEGQRYPEWDWPDQELAPNLNVLCFPEAIKLMTYKPRPLLYRLVLTGMDGNKQYCVALRFYETLTKSEVHELYEKMIEISQDKKKSGS